VDHRRSQSKGGRARTVRPRLYAVTDNRRRGSAGEGNDTTLAKARRRAELGHHSLIEDTILNGLCHVGLFDQFARFQVRNSPRKLEDSVIGPG